jgi:hypothetical protein
MKNPKDEPDLMEALKRGLEEAVDSIDLDGVHVPAKVMRQIQRLHDSGDYGAAKDLYVSSVMDGVSAAEEKQQLNEWARSRGGVNRGAQKTREARQIRKWLYPLLTECDVELPAERKQRGWRTMQTEAKRKLNSKNMDDPRKDLITQTRIQTWIEQGRPKK